MISNQLLKLKKAEAIGGNGLLGILALIALVAFYTVLVYLEKKAIN